MLKIILVILFVLVVGIIAVRLQGGVYQRFMLSAAEVMGKIEKKETRIDNNHSQRNKQENILIYSYVLNGTVYRDEERVEYDDMWLDAHEGMYLRVYYSKTDPAKSYPAALIDRRLNIASKVQ